MVPLLIKLNSLIEQVEGPMWRGNSSICKVLRIPATLNLEAREMKAAEALQAVRNHLGWVLRRSKDRVKQSRS
jgi:hypothetical protein